MSGRPCRRLASRFLRAGSSAAASARPSSVSSMSPEAERQLQTALDWARYGEVFDFDPDSEEFILAPRE